MGIRAVLIALLWALVGPGSQVHAQDTRRYQVELILFTPRSAPPSQGERFDDAPLPPDLDRAVDLEHGPLPEGFQVLPAGAAGLAGVKARLQGSGRYRVIAHKLWQQPGLDQAAAMPVRVRGGTDYSARLPHRQAVGYGQGPEGPFTGIETGALDEVDGTVTVVLGRYLHLHTDLVFRTPLSRAGAEPRPPQELARPGLVSVRVQGQRRMRSRELHYLDHPLLGVLVQITPVETPAPTGPAAAAPAASAPGPSPR